MPILQIYHSSPDYPVITGREIRREGLLKRLTESWHNNQKILGLYGTIGIGKTTTALQFVNIIQNSSQ